MTYLNMVWEEEYVGGGGGGGWTVATAAAGLTAQCMQIGLLANLGGPGLPL